MTAQGMTTVGRESQPNVLARAIDRYISDHPPADADAQAAVDAAIAELAGPGMAEVARLQSELTATQDQMLVMAGDLRALKYENYRLRSFAGWATRHRNSYTRLLAQRALRGEWELDQ